MILFRARHERKLEAERLEAAVKAAREAEIASFRKQFAIGAQFKHLGVDLTVVSNYVPAELIGLGLHYSPIFSRAKTDLTCQYADISGVIHDIEFTGAQALQLWPLTPSLPSEREVRR